MITNFFLFFLSWGCSIVACYSTAEKSTRKSTKCNMRKQAWKKFGVEMMGKKAVKERGAKRTNRGQRRGGGEVAQ
jgi:hypothetical protein